MSVGDLHRPPAVPLHVIVVAGGEGHRARTGGDEAPKQFQLVGGRLLLLRGLDAFLAVPGTASVTVAAPPAWQAVVREALAATTALPAAVCDGGATRTASTGLAAEALLHAFDPRDDDLVAVHDAARPWVTAELVARLAAAAADHGGAVPGVEVTDTVVALDDPGDDGACGLRYLPRAGLRALQTPQVFRWRPFLEAHRWARASGAAFTDDGGLLAARGLPPVLVPGEPGNLKVTTAEDLAAARARAEERP
ncbi:MAG: 2-C-methyl-D-erythritol 4-phosphate cytidylyltransferase [bacterium]|nr:2-C-methyl-D-erythritol 4-phosphate cytidylyltransferase [bacterium]